MLNKEQKELIKANEINIHQVINQGYQVNPTNDTVKLILKIADTIKGAEVCRTCPDYITDAYRVVWKTYKEDETAKKVKKAN